MSAKIVLLLCLWVQFFEIKGVIDFDIPFLCMCIWLICTKIYPMKIKVKIRRFAEVNLFPNAECWNLAASQCNGGIFQLRCGDAANFQVWGRIVEWQDVEMLCTFAQLVQQQSPLCSRPQHYSNNATSCIFAKLQHWAEPRNKAIWI